MPATIYKFVYTSGPFALPHNAQSIDWVVLNNDTTKQKIRVTVFKCPIGMKTVEPPGPLELTVLPGETTHNANNAVAGMLYEIKIECNSQMIFPYASAWLPLSNDPIPGTVVKSAQFIRMLS